MISILQRPEGHVISTTENTATASESYGAGDAQFVSPTVHGLIDGDFIYAISDIEDYAGFWYVDATTTGIFKIKPYAGGDYVQFISDGSITWYKSVLTHGWSCVHLPITYRLSSDLYPVNSSDTSRTITSVTDSHGYSVVHLSGDIGAAVNSYDFIKLTVPNDTDLSGVYQILEFISPTVLLINLDYDSGNDFTSASAIKHYNNYNMVVRIYAGLNSSHQWAAQKPYELAATKEFIPDENNEAFFSIDDILRSYIETRNNTQLGTLPNNIDFWTEFYIEYAERYDDSDGYAFGTFTGNYTSDQATFEGKAANAKLEFKNIYSGYLSEYLMTNNAAKFLTLFTIPVLFGCTDDPVCYQDISFINPYDDVTIVINKKYYSNDVLQSTVETQIYNGDNGVIRTQVEADCDYDRVDMYAFIENLQVLSDPAFADDPFEDWSNEGSGQDWNPTGSVAIVNVLTGSENSKELTQTFPYIIFSGSSGSIMINTYVNNDSVTFTIKAYYDNTLVQTITSFTCDWASPTNTIAAFTAAGDINKITIECDLLTGTDIEANVDNVYLYGDVTISETKEFEIDCGCSGQELRLTWLNNLAGFDYWNFTAQKDHLVEIREAIETKKNILPSWPKSYGANADTIRKQTAKVSNKAYTVRSQFLTADEVDAIAYIKSSVLVQIINSLTDRRTVIVDSDSFVKRKDGDKTFEIAFNISFTDDIPSQTT